MIIPSFKWDELRRTPQYSRNPNKGRDDFPIRKRLAELLYAIADRLLRLAWRLTA